ncbi:ABC transporter ATP-binding protein [Deinococcus sonorensis]|uniref:ABC transporter ATP-binding protein n=2 Tax=Deinococcus sonorensis TaxID=309891 RepID=A0AAU7UB76_9DEIO
MTLTASAQTPSMPVARPVALEIQNLGKRLGGNTILDGLNLQVHEGEIVALLGPSGSGKTTLLRCISGLEAPDAGTLTIAGREMYNAGRRLNVPPEGRNLGLVFQSYALWPHRTVAQNVAFGLEQRRVPKAELTERVQAVLDQLGLGALAGRYPGQLSGGQQQRVSLARAFVTEPSVLLLDEPLSNLDAKLREHARVWLREALNASGKTAIFVTHDQSEAMAVADRVAILRGGRLTQYDAPEQVYAHPNSLFVADFIGNPNILEASNPRPDGHLTRVDVYGTSLVGVGVPDPELNGQTRVVLRQEALLPGAPGQPNTLSARRVSSVFLGPVWEHWVEIHGQRLRFHTPGRLTDEQVHIHIPANQLLIFY